MKEIWELVPAKHWSHCPGKDNPVTLPLVGFHQRKWKWAYFRDLDQIDYPKSYLGERGEEVTVPEVRAVEMVKYQNLTHSLLSSTKSNDIGDMIACKRFSKLQKLLRVTVYVQKFVLTFKSLIRGNSILID